MERLIRLDYVWLGGDGTQSLRTKVKYDMVEAENPQQPPTPEELFSQISDWSYDGSSTNQAETKNSDLILKAVKIYGNPFVANQGRASLPSYVVYCEVFNADGTPHESNQRAKLRDVLDSVDTSESDPIFGIEQEYVFWDPAINFPSGWEWDSDKMKGKEPEKSDAYYCGIGGDAVVHRQLAEAHSQFCLQMQIPVAGFNSEVMKSQWEYQLQPKSALEASDNLWMSRYVLHRLVESRGLSVNLDPKPMKGWSGSGAHINISTSVTREGTLDVIEDLCTELGESHVDLISSYGENNEKRLTGDHETEAIDTFSYGQMDRTTSVRIPSSTILNGTGHVEDRRPASNVNPYIAFQTLVPIINGELSKV